MWFYDCTHPFRTAHFVFTGGGLKYFTGENANSPQPCEIFAPKFPRLHRRDTATILEIKKNFYFFSKLWRLSKNCILSGGVFSSQPVALHTRLKSPEWLPPCNHCHQPPRVSFCSWERGSAAGKTLFHLQRERTGQRPPDLRSHALLRVSPSSAALPHVPRPDSRRVYADSLAWRLNVHVSKMANRKNPGKNGCKWRTINGPLVRGVRIFTAQKMTYRNLQCIYLDWLSL